MKNQVLNSFGKGVLTDARCQLDRLLMPKYPTPTNRSKEGSALQRAQRTGDEPRLPADTALART